MNFKDIARIVYNTIPNRPNRLEEQKLGNRFI
jgi:hypothetical protein